MRQLVGSRSSSFPMTAFVGSDLPTFGLAKNRRANLSRPTPRRNAGSMAKFSTTLI